MPAWGGDGVAIGRRGVAVWTKMAAAMEALRLRRLEMEARVDASAKEVAGLEQELAAARHGTFECPTHWTDRSLAVTK